MELTVEYWQQLIALTRGLIELYPTYQSQGNLGAGQMIEHFLREQQWDRIVADQFWSEEISSDEEYVDVKAFGSLYKDYDSFAKHNIVGVIENPPVDKTLILNGHFDVDFLSAAVNNQCKIENERLFGRGACDMLSGLASLICVGSYLNQKRSLWKGRLILTAVTDEEIGGNGTLRALHWLKQHHYLEGKVECLIAEPTDKTICDSSLGFLRLLIDIAREPIHMGVATKQNSSIWDAVELIQHFEQLLLQAALKIEQTVTADQLRYNFGIIQGGKDAAVPIGQLQLEATIFFPSSIKSEELAHTLSAILREYNPFLQCRRGDFTFKGATYSASQLKTVLLSTADLQSIKEGVFPSPCDARLFEKYGIPVTIYGPGSLARAHSDCEWIALDDLKEYNTHLMKAHLHYFQH